jgi:uncharacterized caspase-like protein
VTTGMMLLIRCLTLLATMLPAISQGAGNLVEKHALVIGNRDYVARQASLPNAFNDANLIAKSLRTLGFKVTQRNNLKRGDFFAAVSEFSLQLPEGSTALVYYAGHGMQIGGGNFLTPVDMTLTSEQSVAIKSYPMKALLEQLAGAKSAVNIVILDACRNNPFQPQSAVRYRSFNDLGLAKTQAPRGTLIAYSTSPGQLAADGTGSNSIYSEALARHLAAPERELEDLFKRISSDVRKSTLDDQIPWFESSLTERYYFIPPEGVSVVPGKSLQMASVGKNEIRGTRRGSQAETSTANLPWYRQLTASEWSLIDWEIQQRVKRLTPDEIPAITHQATGGSVVAQTVLGLAYREGIDKAVEISNGRTMRFKANNTKALQWLRTAAENGFPVAQAELGEMYYTGHGVDRDLRKAAYWLEQAVVAEYPRAKLNLLQVQVETGSKAANPAEALRSMMESFR